MFDFNKKVNDFEEFYLKRDAEKAKAIENAEPKKAISDQDNPWPLLLMITGFILLVLGIGAHAYAFNELVKENQSLREKVDDNAEMVASLAEITAVLAERYAEQREEIKSLKLLAENGGVYVEPNDTDSAGVHIPTHSLDSSVSDNKPVPPDPSPNPKPDPIPTPSPDPTPSLSMNPSPGLHHEDIDYH